MTNVPPPIVNLVNNISLEGTNVALINKPPVEISSLPQGSVIEVIAVKENPNTEDATAFFLNSIPVEGEEQQEVLNAKTKLLEFNIKLPKNLPKQVFLQLKLSNINPNSGMATLKIIEKISVNNLKDILQKGINGEKLSTGITTGALEVNDEGVVFEHGKPINATLVSNKILNPNNNQIGGLLNDKTVETKVGNNFKVGNLSDLQKLLQNPETKTQQVNSTLPNGSVLTLRITELDSPVGQNVLNNGNSDKSVFSNERNSETSFLGQKIENNVSNNPNLKLGEALKNIVENGGIEKKQAEEGNIFRPVNSEKNSFTVSSKVNNNVLASVIGKTDSGQSIVSSNLGIMVLETKTSLPINTNVKIEVLEVNFSDSAKAKVEQELPVSDYSNENIKNIAEDFKNLMSEAPEVAKQVAVRVPQPNSNLAANIINFITAVQNNDASVFLGDENLKSLAKLDLGRKVVKSVEKEITEASKKVKDSKGWKTFDIPFMPTSGDIKSIAAIIRREGGSPKSKGSKIAKQRFIINFNMSNLGEMQIDTLVVKEFKKLDIVLRNKKELPKDVAIGIGQIFRDTIDSFGYAGTLSFMVTNEFYEISEEYDEDSHQKGIIA